MNTAVVASIAYLRILSRGWPTSRSPIPPTHSQPAIVYGIDNGNGEKTLRDQEIGGAEDGQSSYGVYRALEWVGHFVGFAGCSP
mmetsp:Transcript_29735/g.40840  ORF Transcript_29735/g.40840 Transcript_29735/m.40840 type:complete len:84 (+) Transcript_29735:142-393(+)